MSTDKHEFTDKIISIIEKHLSINGEELFDASPLLQYLNKKTKAATRDSKARLSIANHYAIYVLVEDYIKNNFHKNGEYKKYEGAQFSDLLRRQRELPFGAKLQNHALNHRANQEFARFFPKEETKLIKRDLTTKRYWISESLLIVKISGSNYNIAPLVIEIIDEYVETLKEEFQLFIDKCSKFLDSKNKNNNSASKLIQELLSPNSDARIFEIVSYSILKQHYSETTVYWGFSPKDLNSDILKLHKTGRTQANDGGIDFVMKPLGRFFQVTESVELGKFFLDIDKVQKFPITFVIKSEEDVADIRKKIETQAMEKYNSKVTKRYMNCIEEIINIPILLEFFTETLEEGKIRHIFKEIILQSRLEFDLPE